MPVTAKLSRRVYEQLGDDVANAIVDWLNAVDTTYKADLRELNDLNFARFDAKVGERFAQFEAKFDARLAQLDAKFDARLAQLNAKVEAGLAQLDAKFEARLTQIESRLENCVDRATFEKRLAGLEVRLSRKIYAVSAAALLTQTVILITLLKFFSAR